MNNPIQSSGFFGDAGLLGGIFGFLLFFAGIEVFFAQLMGDEVERAAMAVLGWPQYAAAAAKYGFAFLAVAMYWAFRHLKAPRRIIIVFFGLLVPALANGAMYLLTQDHIVDAQGNPLKCYVIEAQPKAVHIRFLAENNFTENKKQIDRLTGKNCVPITAHSWPIVKRLMKTYETGAEVMPVDPDESKGYVFGEEVLLWMDQQPDGQIKFYPIPGYVWGRPLKPATREILDRHFEKKRSAVTRNVLSGSVNFDANGQPLKCFFVLDRSVKVNLLASPHKIDPATGAECIPLTRELISRVDRLLDLFEHGKGPSPIRDLDPGTESPALWFVKDSAGQINLFDLPVLIDGRRATVASPDVIKAWRQQGAQRTATTKAGGNVERVALTKPAGPLYADVSVLPPGGVRAVAFRGDAVIARRIIQQLPQPVSVALFTPAFFRDGVFDQVLLGDTSRLRALQLGNMVEAVYMIQIDDARTTSYPGLEGLTKAQQTVHLMVIDPRTGAVTKSLNVTLEGKGFSAQTALNDLQKDVERRLAGAM